MNRLELLKNITNDLSKTNKSFILCSLPNIGKSCELEDIENFLGENNTKKYLYINHTNNKIESPNIPNPASFKSLIFGNLDKPKKLFNKLIRAPIATGGLILLWDNIHETGLCKKLIINFNKFYKKRKYSRLHCVFVVSLSVAINFNKLKLDENIICCEVPFLSIEETVNSIFRNSSLSKESIMYIYALTGGHYNLTKIFYEDIQRSVHKTKQKIDLLYIENYLDDIFRSKDNVIYKLMQCLWNALSYSEKNILFSLVKENNHSKMNHILFFKIELIKHWVEKKYFDAHKELSRLKLITFSFFVAFIVVLFLAFFIFFPNP